jgi:hypothetical protein
MQNWINAAFGTIAAAFVAGMSAAIKQLRRKQKATEDGLQALLHDRIFSIYSDCYQKGYASIDDIRNLDYLYQPYHALGGNGTGTELYERVKKMPAEQAEQEA